MIIGILTHKSAHFAKKSALSLTVLAK